MWGKNVAFVVIRPQRYTKEFIDASTTLSLSVLPEEYRKTLSYLGTVSGRDENKIEKAELTVVKDGETPYFAESNHVLICEKLFAQPYSPDAFMDSSIPEKVYSAGDYHTLYICEIKKVLERE